MTPEEYGFAGALARLEARDNVETLADRFGESESLFRLLSDIESDSPESLRLDHSIHDIQAAGSPEGWAALGDFLNRTAEALQTFDSSAFLEETGIERNDVWALEYQAAITESATPLVWNYLSTLWEADKTAAQTVAGHFVGWLAGEGLAGDDDSDEIFEEITERILEEVAGIGRLPYEDQHKNAEHIYQEYRQDLDGHYTVMSESLDSSTLAAEEIKNLLDALSNRV
ncbi:hypothetical protein ACIRS1_27335 [Kitasatospora sp. NPDC101176]|uniref:hypothetical protein n=1 Tax=Kitasatospora sp. NPDC101176 TaxID=3364099 RepID=UPI003821AC09